jgi:hypothetical protein
VNIFSFSFHFSFASLNFDHPRNKKDQSRVLLNPSFLFTFCIFCLLLILTGDGRLHLQKNIYVVDGLGKFLQAKVTCNTRSKSGGRTPSESPKELHLQDREEINLIATHPRKIVPQDCQSN